MNKFQKYWSYINRIVVEQTSSDFNEKLIIAIQDGKYVLNAKNANFSFASLHRVFQQAFQKIKINDKSTQSILVLGCGAGSIPKIVYKELGLNPEMDAVEIDDKVIDLGNKYFGLNKYENLNIIVDDASQYLKNTTKKYDLICVDIFDGLNVPQEFLTQHFFEQLKSKLSDKGELLFNFVAYNFDTKKQVKEIENQLTSLFSKTETYKIEGINRMFYSIK